MVEEKSITNKDVDKMVEHLSRIINNLNQHWHSIQLLLSSVSKPLLIDDRGLQSCLHQIRDQAGIILHQYESITESMKTLDITTNLAEIKYIGKRLSAIESDIQEIKNKGIKQKVKLNFIVDGYELVEKTDKHDVLEPVSKEEEKMDPMDRVLSMIPENYKTAIKLRLAIDGGRNRTFIEVGKIMKVSSSTARQYFRRGIRSLRQPSKIQMARETKHKGLIEEIESWGSIL